MARVNVLFATGYEEVEALTVVDLLRRAGIETDMVSTTDSIEVVSSHNVAVKMDKMIDDIDMGAELLVCPGGIPGVPNLLANEKVVDVIKKYDADDKKMLAAICAGPTIYGKLGLLKGKKATCYPNMEGDLLGAQFVAEPVVVDGKYITSRGLGTAIEFGLKIVSILKDKESADSLSKKIVYTI